MKIVRALLVGVVVAAGVLYAVGVHAQAGALNPFDAFTAVRTNPAIWQSLVALGTGAMAAIAYAGATAAATLTAPAVLTVGVVVAATVMMTGDTAVVVAQQPIEQAPNPDLVTAEAQVQGGGTGTTSYVLNAGGVSYPYMWVNKPNTGNPAYDAATWDFVQRVNAWLLSQGFSRRIVNQTTGAGLDGTNSNANYGWLFSTPGSNSNCPSGSCVILYYSTNCPTTWTNVTCSTGTVPASVKSYVIGGSSSTTAALYAAAVPLTQGLGFNCPAGSQYSQALSLCLAEPANRSLTGDGVCRVSFNSAGCPVRNPFDGDCANVQLTCGSGVGSVKLDDAATGKQLEIEQTAATTNIKESTPNYNTGTREQRTVQVGRGTGVVQNITNNYFVGTTPPATGSPSTTVSQVAVTNWPSGLTSPPNITVNPNVTVNPVVTVSPTPVTVNLPDTVTVNNEGKSEELEALPERTEDVKTFLDPVKEKLAGVLGWELQKRPGTCPTLDIDWHVFEGKAYEQHYVLQSNAMCLWLEEQRELIANIVMFAFVLGAILIVLGA